MIFYRVAVFTDNGTSAGFEWHASLKDAQKGVAEAIANDPNELREPEIERVEIRLTRAGVLMALRHYADHPDNG